MMHTYEFEDSLGNSYQITNVIRSYEAMRGVPSISMKEGMAISGSGTHGEIVCLHNVPFGSHTGTLRRLENNVVVETKSLLMLQASSNLIKFTT